ncbi:MAG: hypothetical protein MUE54_04275 [Anaerolineae bacterium]|jgi:hypothetical protein|nr:hypothetical protein [Anaerolineae bacterium]
MTTDFTSALGANIRYLDSTAQNYLGNRTYRDFYRWALTEDNPQQLAWIQAIGLAQLVRMTYQLLHGLVRDEDWKLLLNDSVTINGYQVYEIVSDNLGIGITHAGSDKLRETLILFNKAMLNRLTTGKQVDISYFEAFSNDISTFLQSQTAQKQMDIVQAYIRQCPGFTVQDFEFNIPSLLVANIETCYAMYRDCDNLIGGKIIQDGLVRRYRAVNDLLLRETMDFDKRLAVSGDAILVAPTLGYYIAVIAERIYKLPLFKDVVESGQLEQVLYDAALVVRMLNDMGVLTKQSAESRQRVIDVLSGPAYAGLPLKEAIGLCDELGTQITRLQKDVFFGEWNLVLYELEDKPVTPETMTIFKDRLAYLNVIYKTTYQRMERGLMDIENLLSHTLVSSVVRRFVEFHVNLYSNDFKTETGEFGI